MSVLSPLVDWLSSLPRHNVVKYVMVWKKALAAIMSQKPCPRNSAVRNMLLVLQHIHNVSIADCRSPVNFKPHQTQALTLFFCFFFCFFYRLKANSRTARHKKIEDKIYCLEMNPEILQQDVQLWRLSQIQVGKEKLLIIKTLN